MGLNRRKEDLQVRILSSSLCRLVPSLIPLTPFSLPSSFHRQTYMFLVYLELARLLSLDRASMASFLPSSLPFSLCSTHSNFFLFFLPSFRISLPYNPSLLIYDTPQHESTNEPSTPTHQLLHLELLHPTSLLLCFACPFLAALALLFVWFASLSPPRNLKYPPFMPHERVSHSIIVLPIPLYSSRSRHNTPIHRLFSARYCSRFPFGS